MLKRLLKITLGTSLLFYHFSCNKNNNIPKGNATCNLNTQYWDAETVYANPIESNGEPLLHIYVIKYNDEIISQHIMFGNVKKTFSRQKLYDFLHNADSINKCFTSFITTQDYDINGDTYYLVESDSANNWLQITSAEDNFTKNIEGTFSATYYRTKTYQGSPNPDTIRLRNGTFYISKLKE